VRDKIISKGKEGGLTTRERNPPAEQEEKKKNTRRGHLELV